jgi:hypothetical protein
MFQRCSKGVFIKVNISFSIFIVFQKLKNLFIMYLIYPQTNGKSNVRKLYQKPRKEIGVGSVTPNTLHARRTQDNLSTI